MKQTLKPLRHLPAELTQSRHVVANLRLPLGTGPLPLYKDEAELQKQSLIKPAANGTRKNEMVRSSLIEKVSKGKKFKAGRRRLEEEETALEESPASAWALKNSWLVGALVDSG